MCSAEYFDCRGVISECFQLITAGLTNEFTFSKGLRSFIISHDKPPERIYETIRNCGDEKEDKKMLRVWFGDKENANMVLSNVEISTMFPAIYS